MKPIQAFHAKHRLTFGLCLLVTMASGCRHEDAPDGLTLQTLKTEPPILQKTPLKPQMAPPRLEITPAQVACSVESDAEEVIFNIDVLEPVEFAPQFKAEHLSLVEGFQVPELLTQDSEQLRYIRDDLGGDLKFSSTLAVYDSTTGNRLCKCTVKPLGTWEEIFTNYRNFAEQQGWITKAEKDRQTQQQELTFQGKHKMAITEATFKQIFTCEH